MKDKLVFKHVSVVLLRKGSTETSGPLKYLTKNSCMECVYTAVVKDASLLNVVI